MRADRGNWHKPRTCQCPVALVEVELLREVSHISLSSNEEQRTDLLRKSEEKKGNRSMNTLYVFWMMNSPAKATTRIDILFQSPLSIAENGDWVLQNIRYLNGEVSINDSEWPKPVTSESSPKQSTLLTFSMPRILTAAVKTYIRSGSKENWNDNWTKKPTGPSTLTKKPTKELLQMFKQTNRLESAVITQTRTGKIGLRGYLYNVAVKKLPA